MLVDNFLKVLVNLVALRKKLIELRLAENAAQRRLRELRSRKKEIFHFDNRLLRLHDPEIHHGVDLDRNVVLRNDILRMNVEDDGPQAHLNHPVDNRDEEDHTRPLGADEAAKAENYAPLILPKYADSIRDNDDAKECQNDEKNRYSLH